MFLFHTSQVTSIPLLRFHRYRFAVQANTGWAASEWSSGKTLGAYTDAKRRSNNIPDHEDMLGPLGLLKLMVRSSQLIDHQLRIASAEAPSLSLSTLARSHE